MGVKIGIDVGGTFTDFLLFDAEGNTAIFKSPTTPDDPTEGVFTGLAEMAAEKGISIVSFLKQVDVIVHGTTITTNAVLTGNGAKTGFVTTKGFRDILNMRRGLKEDQYETKYAPPQPLVPRRLIQSVEERTDCEGKELVPLNRKEVQDVVDYFKKEKVEALGVSFLFSFFNPEHENELAEMLATDLPDVYVSLSSEIIPQVRVYERNSTVALNAFVGPKLKSYLSSLKDRLESNGFQGVLLIMQSNGGVMSPEVAIRFAVNTLLSGPAGGPAAGISYANPHELKNLITVDMGGTSFDASLIMDLTPGITVEASIARHRIALPVIDIHTIGAGGGSIAWIDTGGILQVGPQSAGAQPGPVCYGRGGSKPTVTDADLILGYLEPGYFFGGKMGLNYEAAERAIAEEVAEPLKMDVVQAANGIYQVVNANMAAGLGVVSVSRGYDPRDFALVVAGGAGPIHAGMIARELEIPLIIIPKVSSVFCAAGMLMSDLRHDYVRTYAKSIAQADLKRLNSILGEMEEEAVSTLKREGIPEDQIVLKYSLDLRYEGQFNEVEVPFSLNSGSDKVEEIQLAEIVQTFDRRHDALYGYALPGVTAEIINLRLSALGITEKPEFKKTKFRGTDPSPAFKKYRSVYFDTAFREVSVYDGQLLGHGNMIKGPAIIEEMTTTIVVPPEYDLLCDTFDNYLMHPKGMALLDIFEKLRRG
ncbi:hydantoinase/oxoprolinase family protein [Paradesulfitobacterium aromaticivorans]